MANSSTPKNGYVKTQTLVFAVFLAFVAGFFSGIVLTILKSGGETPAGVDAGTAAQVNEQRQMQEQMQEQIGQLEELTKRSPQDIEAWTRLGHLYFDSNQPAKAITAYENSLRLRPENADVWTDLGVMYRRNKQPEEAIRAFDRAIEVEPKHEIARFNKGIVLIHDLSQFDAGIQSWKELVDMNPMARAPNGQTVDELIRQLEAQQKKQ